MKFEPSELTCTLYIISPTVHWAFNPVQNPDYCIAGILVVIKFGDLAPNDVLSSIDRFN